MKRIQIEIIRSKITNMDPYYNYNLTERETYT